MMLCFIVIIHIFYSFNMKTCKLKTSRVSLYTLLSCFLYK